MKCTVGRVELEGRLDDEARLTKKIPSIALELYIVDMALRFSRIIPIKNETE